MNVISVRDVCIEAVSVCLPRQVEDNLARLKTLYGDDKKAQSVVNATGIRNRRIAPAGVSSLDLCVKAAEGLVKDCRDEINAIVQVTFTPEKMMPNNASQAQHRLGLAKSVVAFDINLACSGYPYGLYIASLMANSLQGKVLLLDGDAQTQFTDVADGDTVSVLADAGTATIVAPRIGADEWKFAFMTDGAQAEALSLPHSGKIAMDGFGVFRFVTLDVLNFLEDFLIKSGVSANELDGFVPHQANIFMIRQIAKKLGFGEDRLLVSGDELGNSSSASIPSTLAWNFNSSAPIKRRLLLAGFGGGLSAGAAIVNFNETCKFVMKEL